MHETVKIDPSFRCAADTFAFTIGFGMKPFRDMKSVSWEAHLKEAAAMAMQTRKALIEAGQPLTFVTVYLSVSIAGRIDSFRCTFDFDDTDDGQWVAKPRSEDARAFRDLDRRLRRFLN